MGEERKFIEYEFPEAKSVVISGDIHGDFNKLVNKFCVQYQMKDTLLIVAGDCGFGFEKKGYYEAIVKRNAKRMSEANNWIVFVRGNHDNPAYFDGKTFCYKRFVAVPDYSIVKACGNTILCVGGAISIDRKTRLEKWAKYTERNARFLEKGALARHYYWEDEVPLFKPEVLNEINDVCAINAVVTHTAPTFCELQTKNGLCYFACYDDALFDDVKNERSVMDEIYNLLVKQNHPITHWCYGHFHQSWHSSIDEILFKMLDIMELYQLPPRNHTIL